MDLLDQKTIFNFLQTVPVADAASDFLQMTAAFLKRYPRFTECLINEPGILLGGAVCYYGTHALSICQDRAPPTDGRISRMTLLYMIVDSLLDRPDVSTTTRQNFKMVIGELLNSSDLTPESILIKLQMERREAIDVFLEMVLKEVYLLFKEVPDAKGALRDAFKSELLSSEIQSKSYHPRAVYLEICREKGATMVVALQKLIGGEITDDIHRLGFIIQLIDDLLDVEEDMAEGNMTIATYDLVVDGHLDHLVELTESEIAKISPGFKFFQQAFEIAMAYVKSRKTHCLKNINPDDLFEYPRLTDLLGEKLCSGLKQLL